MIRCTWMGLSLKSPIILASLTLCSRPNIQHHLAFFQRAKEYGVGAIILPSIHPLRKNESIGNPHVRTATLSTGLHHSNKSNCMGFAVLGTTDNIVSVEYGLNLACNSTSLGIPIIGSISNIGTEDDFLETVHQLSHIPGLSGLELNFSCPNVQNGLPLSISLLKKINFVNKNHLPISIKLSPREDYSHLLSHQHLFDGITLSNAYTGLVPPDTSKSESSPFGDMSHWRPTGVYGPQEKYLTFYDIWNFKTNPNTNTLQLSSVGGFVNGDDVLQAILLGSDSVQLSSAIFWNGLSIIQNCNHRLESYLKEHSLSFSQIKGSAFKQIVSSDSDLANERPHRTMTINKQKCKTCTVCNCIERSCYAITQAENKSIPVIDKLLCSGCGWCQKMCLFNAIE